MTRLAVLMLPFRVIAPRLGARETESTYDDNAAWQGTLLRIRWAILAASRRAPWRCKCLEQAIAAKKMLRSRGVSSTLYLGVARAESVQAHAWLRCGSTFVVGGDGTTRFAVVSKFGEKE